MLVSDVLRAALVEIGVVAHGEIIPGALATTAFVGLNSMLQNWAVEGLLLHAPTLNTISTVTGTPTYTIGASGTFNVRRPVEIVDAVLTVSTGVYAKLDIYNSMFRYRAFPSRPPGQPREIFYEATFTLGSITFYPTPDAVYSVDIYSLVSIVPFTNHTDTVPLPPEYEYALSTNLAAHLLSAFGKTDALLVSRAQRTKEALFTNNSKRLIQESSFDLALRQDYVYTIATDLLR